jgi:hypothetical protein
VRDYTARIARLCFEYDTLFLISALFVAMQKSQPGHLGVIAYNPSGPAPDNPMRTAASRPALRIPVLKPYLSGALCLLFSLAVGMAQQAPVPVEQEPYHHVVLKNDDIVVIHAILPCGREHGLPHSLLRSFRR